MATRRNAFGGARWITLGAVGLAGALVWTLTPSVTVCTFPGRKRTESERLMSAIMLYRTDNPNRCPTLQTLKDERYLDQSVGQHDEWGESLSIECRDGLLIVKSGGPASSRTETEDDLDWAAGGGPEYRK